MWWRYASPNGQLQKNRNKTVATRESSTEDCVEKNDKWDMALFAWQAV
jgi:hypothetical protein